jgi:hypothetical protein
VGWVLDEALVLKWALQLCSVLHYQYSCKPPIIFRMLTHKITLTSILLVQVLDAPVPDLSQSNFQVHLSLAEQLLHMSSHAFGTQEVQAQLPHRCNHLYPIGSALNNGRTFDYSLCTSLKKSIP